VGRNLPCSSPFIEGLQGGNHNAVSIIRRRTGNSLANLGAAVIALVTLAPRFAQALDRASVPVAAGRGGGRRPLATLTS